MSRSAGRNDLFHGLLDAGAVKSVIGPRYRFAEKGVFPFVPGESVDGLDGILFGGVDEIGGAESAREIELLVGDIDGDDLGGSDLFGRADGTEPDAEDGDLFPSRTPAVPTMAPAPEMTAQPMTAVTSILRFGFTLITNCSPARV